MKKDQLSTAIRAVGFFLTYSEGDKLTNKQSSNDISKENFVEICLKLDNKYSPYDVLMSAFQVFLEKKYFIFYHLKQGWPI